MTAADRVPASQDLHDIAAAIREAHATLNDLREQRRNLVLRDYLADVTLTELSRATGMASVHLKDLLCDEYYRRTQLPPSELLRDRRRVPPAPPPTEAEQAEDRGAVLAERFRIYGS